ncbi:MAG: cell division protein ZipA C-terminal FtsZ-binding domain-containing protein [Gammaproteobacteria bacterium]|jgi:cell division protein ZipA
MDSTELRILLFVLGVAFVAGIYFWDKRKHVDSRFHNLQSKRKARRHDASVFSNDARGDISHEHEPEKNESAQANSPNDDFEIIMKNDAVEQVSIDDDLSFSAVGAFEEFEAGADLPTKILQVNLISRKNEISGQMILDLASELNLTHGEFNIFHRMDEKTGKSIFSMANLVEPGSFDLNDMQNLKTPGLTLFSQLPAPVDCMTAFSEMMNAAKRISYILGAELQDGSHSVMTSQSIEHERDAVLQYKQKLQLAMQKL